MATKQSKKQSLESNIKAHNVAINRASKWLADLQSRRAALMDELIKLQAGK